MRDEFLLEILYSVFVSDIDAFLKFIECVISFSFRFQKQETEFLLWVIEDQLRYVIKKREDASHASSKIVELLNQLKKVFKRLKHLSMSTSISIPQQGGCIKDRK